MPDQTTVVAGLTQTPPNTILALTLSAQEWKFVSASTPPPNNPYVLQFWSDVDWLMSTDIAAVFPVFVPFDAGDRVNVSIPPGSSIFVKAVQAVGNLNSLRVA